VVLLLLRVAGVGGLRLSVRVSVFGVCGPAVCVVFTRSSQSSFVILSFFGLFVLCSFCVLFYPCPIWKSRLEGKIYYSIKLPA